MPKRTAKSDENLPASKKQKQTELNNKDTNDSPAQKKVPRKRTKFPDLLEDDVKNTDIKLVRKKLLGLIKRLAKEVDDDWHDGFEGQDETIEEFKAALVPILQAVYNIAVKSKREFVRCHGIIQYVADCWDNINAIPKRTAVDETFFEEDFDLEDSQTGKQILSASSSFTEILQPLWSEFLLSAAGCTSDDRVSDEVMFRFIKDATDYGVNVLKATKEDGARKTTALMDPGMTRLVTLYNMKSSWQGLNTVRVKHNMRRLIDRRYDGAKEKRTRWFPEDEEREEDGCHIS